MRRLPRSVLIGLGAIVAAGSIAAAWGPLSRQVSRTTGVMVTADPPLLVLAILAGAAAVLATGVAWVVAARELGSCVDFVSGSARYVVACLAPPKLGNPVRIALLGRTLPGPKRLWAMTGVCGGVSIVRMLPLSLVIVIAAATAAPTPARCSGRRGRVATTPVAPWRGGSTRIPMIGGSRHRSTSARSSTA